MEENHEVISVIVTSMLDGIDTNSIYDGIYLAAKYLIEKVIDINFLEDELYEEFSVRNKMRGENFEIPEGYECPVCYNEKTDDTYFKFECSHILCAKCLTSLLINNHDRCPMCRGDIVLGNCKINKIVEEPIFSISEDEIENIVSDYVNDFISNIRNNFL